MGELCTSGQIRCTFCRGFCLIQSRKLGGKNARPCSPATPVRPSQSASAPSSPQKQFSMFLFLQPTPPSAILPRTLPYSANPYNSYRRWGKIANPAHTLWQCSPWQPSPPPPHTQVCRRTRHSSAGAIKNAGFQTPNLVFFDGRPKKRGSPRQRFRPPICYNLPQLPQAGCRFYEWRFPWPKAPPPPTPRFLDALAEAILRHAPRI